MKLINNLRIKVGLAKIKSLKTVQRNYQKMSYKEAGCIGILLPVKTEADLSLGKQVIHELKAGLKDFSILGYGDLEINEKMGSYIEVITANDLNLDYTPKKGKIKSFLSLEYDILINLCTELCIPLVYVAAKSKSHFKIGKYHPNLAKYYDFMIDSHEVSVSGFLKEIKHYLLKIK